MRLVFFFLSFLFFKNTSALEIFCKFEEVYQNGEIQQGIFLVKDDKFRYEYNSKDLYTIIHNQNIFLLIENIDTTKYFKIDKDTEVLESMLTIINDYPDFKKNYYLKNASLRVELNKEDFIKRIVLLSDKVNLSVYINDCEFSTIENIYFSYSPFFKYKY